MESVSSFGTLGWMASNLWNSFMGALEEPNMIEPGPINNLPTEILLQIFSDLRLPDLAFITRVNRRWNSIGIPILYENLIIGDLRYNADEMEKAIRRINCVTLLNQKLCAFPKRLTFHTTSNHIPEKEIIRRSFPNLEVTTSFSLDRNCDLDSCRRVMSATSVPKLKELHIGLRCERAELGFPALFTSSIAPFGLPCLEKFRYSRLRTEGEITKMGELEVCDRSVLVEESLAGGPLEGIFDGTMIRNQLFMTYIHYLSVLPSLKVLDLDIGITPDTFTDLRDTISENFKTITDFLSAQNADSSASSVRAREKLGLLPQQQFNELTTDITDEITRQTTKEIDGLPRMDFLPPVDHFHPKRNQVRAKLATLRQCSLEELVIGVRNHLLRSYPRLSVPGRKYNFEPSPPFENSTFNTIRPQNLTEQVRLLRVGAGGSRDRLTRLLLRDMQAYVTPLIYECLEDYEMVTVQKVRIRLVTDGPWIEVLIQRDDISSDVEVLSFLPDVVMTDDEKLGLDGERWGVYAVYKNKKRAISNCVLLSMKNGRWGPKTRPGVR